MPQIEHDPALEVCPNFSSAPFLATRNLIITANPALTHKEAEYEQQQGKLQAARDEADRLAQEEEDWRQEEQAQKEQAEQLKIEKKKPKLKLLDRSRMVGDQIDSHPSTYALNKLENHEYIELWYFTTEGCQDTANYQHTVADETFGLSKVNNFLALHTVSASKASQNTIKDMDLTWRQMEMAKNLLLLYMGKLKWPDKYVQSLAGFFINIDMSSMCSCPNGERALLVYQAWVCREWHDTIKHSKAFDISVINQELLRNIKDKVHDTVHAEALKQVSSFTFP